MDTPVTTTTRPWYERTRFVAPMAAFMIVAGLGVAAASAIHVDVHRSGTIRGATSLQSKGSHPAEDDVRLVDCRPDAAEHWTPHVAITNHSSKASAYVLGFDIERRHGHEKVGEAGVVIARVGAGRTVQQVGVSSVEGRDLFCRMTSVIRVAA
jgi:hypothetical protein